MTEWGNDDRSSVETVVPSPEVQDASEDEAFLIAEPELQQSWLSRLRRLGETATEAARIKANQLVHGFGSDRFWHQMGEPYPVETSFGTGHMVRILSKRSRGELGAPDNTHVLIANPLGASSAGGHMAEIANIFYEAGCTVWNVSPAGYEGNLPWGQVPKLTVKQQAKYIDEALDKVCERLGVNRPNFDKYGGSQGGGVVVGLVFRDIARGRQPGKTVAVTPSSGHNSRRLGRTLRYAKQFTTEEPVAMIEHLRRHPSGAGRRSLQLIPSVSLKPGALKHLVGASYGLIFQPGHEDFLADVARDEELGHYFDHDRMVVVCFSKDVVARAHKWPETSTLPLIGSHMSVVDERYARFAVRFFEVETEAEPVARKLRSVT